MKTMMLMTLATAATLLNTAGALAKTWIVDGNLYEPEQQIRVGLGNGTLNKAQAAQFRQAETKLCLQENTMRLKNSGNLTKADEKELSDKLAKLIDRISEIEGLKADNTGRNFGDTRIGAKTPQMQTDNKNDVFVIGAIRRTLMHDKELSLNAKNVKVICSRGVVVLRGAVDSYSEKATAGEDARQINGVTDVENELSATK
jgi:hypothetical protein